MRRVLIVGATSAIAEAVAREFAARGDALYLAGRSPDRLGAIAADLKIRGASIVACGTFDARQVHEAIALIDHATKALSGLDTVLIAHGTLSDQQACAASIALTLDEFATNALSVMALCSELANRFETQGCGTIAVISSVAGDRGRQSNYIYGAAKATVTAFTSGLRQRLHAKGVRVITIKPGFVDTPMTAAFKKGLLWASAATVAKSIVRAIDRGTAVIYVPGFWRPIMFIIRSIPETIFQKLKL
jgi:short-subunit dehydrogenase